MTNYDDAPDDGNGTSLGEPESQPLVSPVIIVQPPAAPTEGKLSLLVKTLPLVGSLLLGAVVATGAVMTKAGCGTSAAYVSEAVARASAPIPALAQRVDAVERGQLVTEERLRGIKDQLNRIEARLIGPAGKVQP